jgi:hypothetical protein
MQSVTKTDKSIRLSVQTNNIFPCITEARVKWTSEVRRQNEGRRHLYLQGLIWISRRRSQDTEEISTGRILKG